MVDKMAAISFLNHWKNELQDFGPGEKHRKYVGFRYVIRVFLMVFFSTLTYLRLGMSGSFRVRVRVGVCRPYNVP